VSRQEKAMTDESILRDSNYAGFYHWPPIWIGENAKQIDGACATGQNSEVYRHTLRCGVKVIISIKGVFVFDFSNWAYGVVNSMPQWEGPVAARMRFMNLFLTCFYSSVYRNMRQTMEKMFINYGTYAFVRQVDLEPFGFGCDARHAAVIRTNEKEHETRRPWHHLVSVDIVSEAIDLTDAALMTQSNDAAILGELLLHAFDLHDSGKYAASHISAWTIVERCMNQIWHSHLEKAEQEHSNSSAETGEKFINSERRKKLTGRDFTASVVSEILSLSDLLPFEQYKLTCDVRQTRNDWLHRLRAIDRTDSAKAINLARFMLKLSNVLDVDIPFHVISSIPIALVQQ
jgi:hypothetical protein